jgi:hypothetical protein
MTILRYTAQDLNRGQLVAFAGDIYQVDFVRTITNQTYLELVPHEVNQPRRTVHIQLHKHVVMEVHIPLM